VIDANWMAVAAALGERSRARTWPNPNVGCVIVKDGIVVGRGWTQSGGRPHAEAMALAQARSAARGATLYVTLEPCAHVSERGPTCSALIAEAGVARVVIGVGDPDPRTDGKGGESLRAAGLEVAEDVASAVAARSLEGFLTRQRHARPHVTLKLATSLDGCIARADGESRWITGDAARAHAHVERSRAGTIIVGRGTWEADSPKLDVRLPGLEDRSPSMAVLSGSGEAAQPRSGAEGILSPEAIAELQTDHVLIEGGAGAAAAFLHADLVDRLLLYTVPILIGAGKPALGDIGLALLADAHGRWSRIDSRRFGNDRLDIYGRVRD
jgi:diaminohydroxyphosphoribosylaminopyrimidine deaminase / 5-amino-6-(5-phosphoribosylamino)uracil reductase